MKIPNPASPLVRGLASVGFVAFTTGLAWASASKAPSFGDDVMPLLKGRCVRCHGPAKQEGGLNLSTPQGIRRGGRSGPAVATGGLERGHLWKRVSAGTMPPDGALAGPEKALLTRWIAAGAPGIPTASVGAAGREEHWAFQNLRAVRPPTVKQGAAGHGPIDRFIQARLEAAGLTLAPEADRHTLIRRVAFDLNGLPPTLEELRDFLGDARPDAYERMADRYLASPRYAERWARYWLDAAGYADSNGYFSADTDRPLAYRYRDYVVRCIGEDRPWDRFLTEQIAGDMLAGYKPGGSLAPEQIELLDATHFLRNSPDGTDSSDGNPDEQRADKYAVLEGQLQIFGSSLFGMTVQCARCHDHKFEPFKQKDYYALQSVLFPAFDINRWIKPKDRVFDVATPAERAVWKQASDAVDSRIAATRKAFAVWSAENRERGTLAFEDRFDGDGARVARNWSGTVPGDSLPAGRPGIAVDTNRGPGAEVSRGELRLIEGGGAGDRALSTLRVFDWTPAGKGEWVQATFDLKAGRDTAPYIGFFIALRDFNDASESSRGGNILLDGNAAGQASVNVDYPGADTSGRGKIGKSGFTPGRNYGVRVTRVRDSKFELSMLVDGIPEEGRVTLSQADLPDGAFGFEYCCGRSFVVDNVRIESGGGEGRTDAERALAQERRRRSDELERQVREFETARPPRPAQIAGIADIPGGPGIAKLLTRGEYKLAAEPVPPAAPGALCRGGVPQPFPASGEAGPRLEFARWLTQPGTPPSALLARVTVNRWWQHHFGTGIVATPENLGYSGALPTHPELLEYLAGRFIAGGWRAKPLHREILLSAAYRQTSRAPESARRIDEPNRLLSRYPLRRLDAEAIRDGMLAISGELDARQTGPYVPTSRDSQGDVVVAESVEGARRRSLYLQQRRTQVPGLLEVFDAPSIVASCTFRPSTTIPLQSLKLLNSEFARLRSAAFARRVLHASPDTRERVRIAFELANGRPPKAPELTSAQRFLAEQTAEYGAAAPAADASPEQRAWTDFCQMLLASNAFLYVE